MQIILHGKSRQPRQPRRRGEGEGRLRAQLPHPARQGEARDAGEPEGVRSASAPSSRRRANEKLAGAQSAAAKLEGLTVQITQKAGVDGRLFGSVTNVDIVEALKEQGIEVEKAMIRMPDGPLKQVGEYPI